LALADAALFNQDEGTRDYLVSEGYEESEGDEAYRRVAWLHGPMGTE
jgi:hypothetical protein